MRTLAALLFIAAVAALALWLARMPTVADGRIVAADRLEEARARGIAVAGMDCDQAIPIGLGGAVFTCIATLAGGATEVVEYTLTQAGQYEPKPKAVEHAPPAGQAPRKPASGDPSAERP
jgi:hypothetical protein